MTQKQLAKELGVSPSHVSDYISEQTEATLSIAQTLCLILGIAPVAIPEYHHKIPSTTEIHR